MESVREFLHSFPEVSKLEWLAHIERELKGGDMDALYWEYDGIRTDPFGHADDFSELPAPLWDATHDWELSEDVVGGNALIMEALSGGAESVQVGSSTAGMDWASYFSGVHLDYIGVYLEFEAERESPAALADAFLAYAGTQGLAGVSLRGGLMYDLFRQPIKPDWRYVVDTAAWMAAHLPRFTWMLCCSDGLERVSEGLAGLLRQAHTCLSEGMARGGNAGVLAAQLQFEVRIGKDYFPEIARLRALRLLWYNLLTAYKLPLRDPVIAVRFREEVYTDDLYTNMIRATTMAMSAVVGGCSRLTVRPYDAGREEASVYGPVFSRRIARNVQHLLKLEAGFGSVADPAAGSYYVENLTRQMVMRAWEDFVERPN